MPQESEKWHQPLRTPRAHFTLTAWCSLLSQVYFLAVVNQISVPFVIFNTNLKCPSLCFYSRNSHCLQMKLQALWAHFTFIFMTDEIRQEPSEPDTRSVEGSGRQWLYCDTVHATNSAWGAFVDIQIRYLRKIWEAGLTLKKILIKLNTGRLFGNNEEK